MHGRIITDGRTLRAMARHGWIEWEPSTDKHWTGRMARRFFVSPGWRHHSELPNWFNEWEYRKGRYRLTYVDGCFHPFVMRLDVSDTRPEFV